MIRISDALEEIVKENPIISFGLKNKLFNLTHLSRFLKPQVEARVKKDVTESALLMNISRLQKKLDRVVIAKVQDFEIEKINVHTNLCVLTFDKTPKLHKKIHQFYTKVQQDEQYISITEGAGEITVIIQGIFLSYFLEVMGQKPNITNTSVSAIGVKFSEEYLAIPGFLYLILQQMTLQNINLVEVSSTGTEFILYIENKYTKLAFDTLYSTFSVIS